MNDPTNDVFQLAFKVHEAGDLREAHRLYHRILQANPGHFQTLYSLGRLHFQCGQFEEAALIAGEAARRNPRSAEAWFLRGSALQRLNRHADALISFARALAERPDFAQAMVNRGASLMALTRPEEALRSFEAALSADASIIEAWNNRGNALSELGRFEEAVVSYDKVLAAIPQMPETLMNRGTALLSLRRYRDALASYDKALSVRPTSADGMSGRGNALFEMKEYDQAAAAYKATLELDPEYKYALGNLAFCRLHCCDWNGLEQARLEIIARLRDGKAVVSPFQTIALSDSAPDNLSSAKIWTADKYAPGAKPLWAGEPYDHEKIRIAYVSGDLRNHAVAKLMAGVFESHDTSRVETIAVSFGPDDGSALRTRVLRAFDRVIDAGNSNDFEIASAIRGMDVDIAVDLMGFTGECRPRIFSYRPAPIQANFLGFPGTMGAPYIDYIVADRMVIPDKHRSHYSEKIISLPHSYLPGDSRQPVGAIPSRTDAGLPEYGFVFCSFNNSYKFTPDMFGIWMRLLRQTEGSVLWLHEGNPAFMRNLKREAEARGVAPARLIFAPFVAGTEDHLARLSRADLFLDTLPYNAHATAYDALTAGVPVLTCPGAGFAGRVAASLVYAAGLPEMIAPSLEDYETLALKLAGDPEMLSALKEKLNRNKTTQPLFDTLRFTRNLETAYAIMRERQRRGEPPADFSVEDSLKIF